MANSNNLKDVQIDVKYKLSALWVAVMCCYIYGDYFSLFVPGRIQDLMHGISGVGTTTPVMLLLFAILMTLPSLMIFLSLALKAKWNKVMNLIMGLFFTVIMTLVVATSLNEWMIFYTYLGIVEILITSAIMWYAWKWPVE